MKYSIIIILFFIISCKEQNHWGKYVINDKIGLDDYWREVTGYDSLQITCNYAGDRLNYNFCYPNEFNPFEYEKHKKDTVFVHDTAVVYDIPKIKKKQRISKWICHNCDTIFVNTPLYIDCTTVKGKRILKLMK